MTERTPRNPLTIRDLTTAPADAPPRPPDRPCEGCGAPIVAIWMGNLTARQWQWHQSRLCPNCMAAVRRQEEQERRDTFRRARLRERAERARLTPELRTRTFETYQTFDGTKAAAWESYQFAGAMRGADRPKRGLLLSGNNGLGKTHLALAVLNEAMRDTAVTGLFVELSDFLAALRASFAGLGQDPGELRDLMAQVDLLVLDDLARAAIPTGERGDWVREEVIRILNRREAAGRPLVMTTDVGRAELTAKLGPPIVSRIFGCCQVLVLQGRDYRIHGGTDA